MKLKLILWLAGLALLCSATLAQAGACAVSVSAPNATIAYVPSNPTNPVSSALGVICTKTGGNTDSPTVSPSLSNTFVATSGLNTINFTLSKTAACPGSVWNSTTPFTYSFTGSGTFTTSSTFYICVATGQNVAAGTYTNTVTLDVNSVPSGSSFTVTILAPASCTISPTLGTLAFGNYTAFGGAVLQSLSASTTCTNTLPYTISLDSNNGVMTGNNLNYSLLLNTTSSGGSNTLNSTGSGLAQTFYINGTLAAGQAGTCTTGSCAGTDSRTLTITY